MKNKPIGGEFWYSDPLDPCENTLLEGYFLNGGRSSLACICRYLKSKRIYKVLLPNYLCPTILDVFDDENIEYIFFKINFDFSIDRDSIARAVDSVKAIMFIHYFGLSMTDADKKYLLSLKEKGLILIEDKVQSLSKDYFGDLAFNSLRKFTALSGSFLQTKIDLEDVVKDLTPNQSYEDQIKKARREKTDFILDIKGSEEKYLDSFKVAEKEYYKQYALGSNTEREQIIRTDFKKIISDRNKNYKYLQGLISDIKSIDIIFNEVEIKGPLGLPVYIENEKRDFLVARLREKNIYLPIHWRLTNDDRFNDDISQQISNEIVTLVIDQRYDNQDMLRLANEIKRIVG